MSGLAFDFSQVVAGPAPKRLIAGFGGTRVERVIEEASPGRWVDVQVGADGRREVWRWSGFDSEQEARQWAIE
jgi:hypothetical protein